MSVLNFPENQFIRIFGESEYLKIATHNISGELAHMRMKIFKKGSPTGKIRIKILPTGNIYLPYNNSEPMAVSEWVELSSIDSDFYGLIRFDFQRNNVSNSLSELWVELVDYTRDGIDNYFAMVFDFPNCVYDNGGTYFNQHPIAIEDFIFI